MFEKWLEEVKNDQTKARCKVCKTELRAHRTDLKKHSESVKHSQNMSENKISKFELQLCVCMLPVTQQLIPLTTDVIF